MSFQESEVGTSGLSDGLKCQKPRNTVEGNSFALLTSFKIHLSLQRALQSNIPMDPILDPAWHHRSAIAHS